MTRKPDPLSPESVLAKVRNQARPGLTPHHAQVIFILERFLAPVAQSAHRYPGMSRRAWISPTGYPPRGPGPPPGRWTDGR
jgi:hypothetical protein